MLSLLITLLFLPLEAYLDQVCEDQNSCLPEKLNSFDYGNNSMLLRFQDKNAHFIKNFTKKLEKDFLQSYQIVHF